MYSSRGKRVANLSLHCHLRSTYPQFYFMCSKPIYDSTLSLSHNLFSFSLKFSDGYGDQYPPPFLFRDFRLRLGFVLVALPYHSDTQNNSRVGWYDIDGAQGFSLRLKFRCVHKYSLNSVSHLHSRVFISIIRLSSQNSRTWYQSRH